MHVGLNIRWQRGLIATELKSCTINAAIHSLQIYNRYRIKERGNY